jgi:UDP-N-acetyl-D-mannosaminuronic acid dehydrogenase
MHFDLCVIGGCGHVGLPLSIAFALRGKHVAIFDVDHGAIAKLNRGELPFMEVGGEEALHQAAAGGKLIATGSPDVIAQSDALVLVLATPIDGHMAPSFTPIDEALRTYGRYLRHGQLLILRSTLYPGTFARIQRWLSENGLNMDVAVCPERITQGRGLAEIFSLPQIISAFSPSGLARTRELFSVLTDDLVEMVPLEAELTKLFTNSWRYIKFAVANQFFMIANELGTDYDVIYRAITHNYPRAADLPGPGFAAGPCLFKDTMQLTAATRNNFMLGHAAMLVNEGLPQYVVNSLKKAHPDLADWTVGILGMAFKADVDDDRDSLSYKLKNLLELEAHRVLCSDPYVSGPEWLDTAALVEQADVIVIATPHQVYRTLDYHRKPVVDIWNILGRGRRI